MVADTLDIIDHMEQPAYQSCVGNRKFDFIDLHQIIRNLAVHEVDVFFLVVYRIDFFLIQAAKRIHTLFQIADGNLSHVLDFPDSIQHCRCRRQDRAPAYVEQFVLVLRRGVFSGNHHVGCLDDPSHEREQYDHFEHLHKRMGIGHRPGRISSGQVQDALGDRIQRYHQNNEGNSRSYDIKQKMNHGRAFCILLSAKTGKKRRYAGPDITSQDQERADCKCQQSLGCHQDYDADGC